MKKVLIGSLLVLVVLGTGAGVYLWTPPAPQVDVNALIEKKDNYDVTIYRDNWGVPHVYGKRDADVAFGIGFAHSEDDWETMQEVVAMSRGTLGQYKGQASAQTDYIVDLFQVWSLVDEKFERDVPKDIRILLQAYADGLNLYGAKHPDETWDGILPVTAKDLVAGYVFRMPFFYGIEKHFAKIFDPSGFAKSDVVAAKKTLLGGPAVPTGSNGFALAPSRSEEGVTRLLVNSHQPFTGPVAWYEARLKSEEGWDIVGGLFPGTPFIGHGHNKNLGWASTVNAPDVVDVYELTLNPDNEDEYHFEGEWRAIEKGSAEFRVKLFGPFSLPIKRDILRSVHGPALRLDHGAFAIRYAGMDEVRHAEQFLRLNKAATFEEWQDVMRMGAVASINYIYADGQGNVAYLYNAAIPRRDPAFEWSGLLPGDDARAIWHDFEPFDALPFLKNPKSGFVINANNTPFRATESTSDLNPADYPVTFGIETNMTNRAMRALELFSDDPKISFEDFARVKYDHAYSERSEVSDLIKFYLELDSSSDSDLKEAQQVLAEWNLQADKDNKQAALALLAANDVLDWVTPILDPDEKISVLLESAEKLEKAHGSLTPTWGSVNRLKRGSINLPLSGGPDTLRAIYGGSTLDGNGQLTAVAGDTLIYFVKWDEHGRVSSQSVHQFGSATLDDVSAHYADQAVLFAHEEMKPVLFDFEDLEPNIQRAYAPGE